MQTINKSACKRTIVYTWYIYPLSALFLVLLWLWSFPTFHQPTTHQKLNIFFATEIKNEAFIKNIQKEYDREKLREINLSYGLPNSLGYTSKLQVAINTADILVLDETTLQGFNGHDDNYFKEISSEVKTTYLSEDTAFYSYQNKAYGVLLRQENSSHWLSNYMDFAELQNYYIVLSVTSKNLGALTSQDNAYYDNALTFINHLLKE